LPGSGRKEGSCAVSLLGEKKGDKGQEWVFITDTTQQKTNPKAAKSHRMVSVKRGHGHQVGPCKWEKHLFNKKPGPSCCREANGEVIDEGMLKKRKVQPLKKIKTQFGASSAGGVKKKKKRKIAP